MRISVSLENHGITLKLILPMPKRRFLDLSLYMSNGTDYDTLDDVNFVLANFPFRDGDVPRRIPYAAYISQLIRSARAPSHVSDFICRNKALFVKLLEQGYRYHKLRKAFS